MKMLLVQIRQDAMAEHEYAAILEKMQMPAEQLVPWNIFESLTPPAAIATFDAMIIGGSGAYCVSEWTIPKELEAIESAIREVRSLALPILGICFGHQLLAHALGGVVTMDRARQETGTYEISCSDEAADDEIFSHLPKTFLAQEGHKDHVTVLPPGAIHLASSPSSENQAFVMPGERIYGVQFHPELSRADVATRLEYYRQEYARHHVVDTSDAGASGKGRDDFSDILTHTKETPDAEGVLRRFCSMVCSVHLYDSGIATSVANV